MATLSRVSINDCQTSLRPMPADDGWPQALSIIGLIMRFSGWSQPGLWFVDLGSSAGLVQLFM